jgi:hypothetical protein
VAPLAECRSETGPARKFAGPEHFADIGSIRAVKLVGLAIHIDADSDFFGLTTNFPRNLLDVGILFAGSGFGAGTSSEADSGQCKQQGLQISSH